MTFRNKTKEDETMIFDVNALFTQKLMNKTISPQTFNQFGKRRGFSNLWWWRRSMASDHENLEQDLRQKVPLLGDDEEVTNAFQLGRDFEVFTEDRIIYINTQWWTGKVVEYMSLPWENVDTWTITTSEIIDWDSELKVYTSIPGLPHMEVRVKPLPGLEQK